MKININYIQTEVKKYRQIVISNRISNSIDRSLLVKGQIFCFEKKESLISVTKDTVEKNGTNYEELVSGCITL